MCGAKRRQDREGASEDHRHGAASPARRGAARPTRHGFSAHRIAITAALTLGVTSLLGCAPEPQASEPPTAPVTTPTPAPPDPPPEVQNPYPQSAAADIDRADSIHVLVNKARPLQPENYVPSGLVPVTEVPNVHGHQLRAEAASALVEMLTAAAAAGVGQGVLQSGYRSYERQQELYSGYVASLGQEAADLTSARPGSSEHQTGLAADIDDGSGCALSACFGDTPLGGWLAEHSWEYGFVLRYPAGTTDITGFEYEPWHFRYVDRDVAREFHQSGRKTLEEHFLAE